MEIEQLLPKRASRRWHQQVQAAAGVTGAYGEGEGYRALTTC